jgi:serine/threonine protein kinase
MPPPQAPPPASAFRSGPPMRLAGWLHVSPSSSSGRGGVLRPRRSSRYVRLDGEVLSVHADEDALPTATLDLRACSVSASSARSTEFRVKDHSSQSGSGLSVKCGSNEEMRTWAGSVAHSCGRSFDRGYVLGALIAQGSSSRVHYAYARDADGNVDERLVFAAKVIKKRVYDIQESTWVDRERYVNATLARHAHVVETVDVFAAVDTVHIVMELMAGGTLASLLDRHSRLPEPHARIVMRDLFSALQHLHRADVVHRDVRPENLFCSEHRFPMALALGDFRLANFVTESKVNRDVLSSMIGDVSYMATEIVRKQKYGPAVDLWSAGVLMYRVLSGSLPFSGLSTRAVYDAIRNPVVDFSAPIWDTISADAKSLVRQLIQPDPHKRISALAASHHAWLNHRPRVPASAPAALASGPFPLPRSRPSSSSLYSAPSSRARAYSSTADTVGRNRINLRSNVLSSPATTAPSSIASADLDDDDDDIAHATRGVSDMIRDFEAGTVGSGSVAGLSTSVTTSSYASPTDVLINPASVSSPELSPAYAPRLQAPPGQRPSNGRIVRNASSSRRAYSSVEDEMVSSRASSNSSDSLQHVRPADAYKTSSGKPSRLHMQPSLYSMRDLSSSSGLLSSNDLRSGASSSGPSQQRVKSFSASSEQQMRIVQSTSLRKIHEDGLQEALRDNPARMKRLLSSKVVQQHLNNTLPYRHKLIVTIRAFVAVFRMRALSNGHSLTRQLSLIADQDKSDRADHVNDIVDKRTAALNLLLLSKKAKEERDDEHMHKAEEAKLFAAATTDRSSMLHFRASQLLSRSRGADPAANPAPLDARRSGHIHARETTRDTVAKVYSRIS